ncbi:glycosyltransferase family protein [Gemmobacter denitrificans]|uniref:Glycosyltransferase n=1 Tax=Gemmobacter denitrificans TaxID=3123040 RepID=A0ABU8BTU6_9RHOB
MTAPRVFFYVQHLLGIGHLARASRIAQALQARGAQVTLVTGGLPVAGFPAPGMDHVALPPLAVSDGAFAGLVDDAGQPAGPAYLDHRRDLLLAAFARCAPDIVVTEAFPFGRRQMRFELLPLLAAIRDRQPRPLLVASLRDILQRKTKPGRDQETVDLVLGHFDRVLVHGDPAFAPLEASFALTAQIRDKISYTGFVCPPAPTTLPDGFDVVVSAGGGAVGAALVGAALGAARQGRADLRYCVITGPNLAQAEYDRLAAAAPENVTLCRFRTDFVALLAASRLSVSQAGYNTVADILVAGCRAVLVPFAAQGETEQSDRAELLARAGRALVLPEDRLTPERLAALIAEGLDRPLASAGANRTDGAAESARLLLSRDWG